LYPSPSGEGRVRSPEARCTAQIYDHFYSVRN
jgi:hypothetical protein